MKSKLHKELAGVGATPTEISGLTGIAEQLGGLGARGKLSHRSNFRLLPIAAMATTTLVIGLVIIAYSQTSLPGSWAYPVKRLSEQAAVAFSPSYRATIMMRWSQEVKALVAQNANSRIVLATLTDYKNEADAYKPYASSNYAAFEYCKTTLQQAANSQDVQNSERLAINNVLSSIRT